MSSTRPPPPPLEPYLALPPETSLILLTGTLACSANWLVCRFIGRALTRQTDSEDETAGVVLVSWMRDLAFWKGELRRTTVRIVSFS